MRSYCKALGIFLGIVIASPALGANSSESVKQQLRDSMEAITDNVNVACDSKMSELRVNSEYINLQQDLLVINTCFDFRQDSITYISLVKQSDTEEKARTIFNHFLNDVDNTEFIINFEY